MHLKFLLDFSFICHIERIDHGFMLDLIGDDCKNDGGQFVFSTSTWECFVIEIFMVGALYDTIHNHRLQIGCVLYVHQQTLT
jgi:hypothetical protein